MVNDLYIESEPGNSVTIADGQPAIIDTSGFLHKCQHPDWFNTYGGKMIGYAENYLSKVIAAYGSEQAALVAANSAAEKFGMGGIEHLSDLNSYMYLLVAMSVD